MRAASKKTRLYSVWLLLALLAGVWTYGVEAQADTASVALDIEGQIQNVEQLLAAWQFEEAQKRAQRLQYRHPDLPAVQFLSAWVKFHQGEHQAAREIADRAAAAFSGQLEKNPRLIMIRAMADATKGFVKTESDDGQVVVWYARGVDRVLVPDLIDTVRRTLRVVGEDLGFRPTHPIVVQVLPSAAALADATGLTLKEIQTSGTIAVCKFGRLMVTSPRVTLRGFGYLDTASHELVHLIISEKTKNNTPIWLHEALAKYEENRWRADEPLYRKGLSPARESRLAKAVKAKQLITFEQMHPSMALLPSPQAAELAFSEVHSVMGFMMQRKGYPGIRQVLDALAKGSQDMLAIQTVYGLDKQRFVAEWLRWLERQPYTILEGDLEQLKQSKPKKGKSHGERTLTRVNRTDLRDHFHLGQLLRARGRTRASVVEYSKARKLAGESHVASWIINDKLGLALASAGQERRARKAFEASLKIEPKDKEAHLHLGRLLLKEDSWLAYLHLREAVRLNPLDPTAHGLLYTAAMSLSDAGDERKDWDSVAKWHRGVFTQVHEQRHMTKGQPTPTKSPPEFKTRPKTAILRVVSTPWARLWVDFRDTGLTTPVYEFEIKAGTHLLGLQVDCREDPYVKSFRVEAGETKVIDVDLCPGQPGLAKQSDVPK